MSTFSSIFYQAIVSLTNLYTDLIFELKVGSAYSSVLSEFIFCLCLGLCCSILSFCHFCFLHTAVCHYFVRFFSTFEF